MGRDPREAYASDEGRYGDLEGGWGDEVIEVLTGRTTHRSDPWGEAAGSRETVTLDDDQFRDSFREVAWGE